MTIDKSIFGIQFHPDENILPTQKELDAFFESARTEDGQELRISDLAKYRQLLKETDAFARHQAPDARQDDLQQQMFYSVLGHSQFVNHALLSAVELYQYHLHALMSLDFDHPTTFIVSAEKEIGRLSRKKIEDVMRMARLREMIGERKKVLATLKRPWAELTAELRRIALYIKDNLVRIEKLCETSIVILAEVEIGRKKEKQLVKDVQTYFKEQFREALYRGRVSSKQDLENAKKELDLLSTEMSVLIREDTDALMALYEAIHGHTKKAAQDIDALLVEIESKKNGSVREKRGLFKRIKQVLVSLISDYRFELKLSRTHTDTAHQGIIGEKRKEMLGYLFEQAQKERRSRTDRRSAKDQRKHEESNYRGPERRSGKDRRAGKSRRR